MKSITIIAPCHNEELNIDQYLERMINTLTKINIDYKIVFIDDGSTDKTWLKILEYKKKYNNIFGIKFTRNFGHQAAIMAGINLSDTDYTFCSDVDLQDPPELLEKMLKKIQAENLDLVFAKRNNNKETFFKKYSSILFYKLFNLISNTKISEQTSDFFIINKRVLLEVKKVNDKDIFLRGLLPWFGFKSSYINFDREIRKKGNSGWPLFKMIDFSLTAFLSFSNFPMRLSFFLSIFSIFIFIILSCYAIYSYLVGDVVKGWTSMFLIMSFFNTIIFLILGIIGEYVGRNYLNSKNKPLFVVDKTTLDE